jgi:hypothetical protein
MGKFTLQTGLMAAALLATSFASAGIDFKTNLTGYNFNAEAANVLNGYVGTFTYNNQNYGQGVNNAMNLTALPAGLTRAHANPTSPNKNATYVFYKQANSVVIGNAARGLNDFNDRQFTKAVVGTPTAKSTLPATATYTYKGDVFNHINSTAGGLNYTVNVNNGSVTGSGSVSGITGKRPSGGVVGTFNISGTLDQVTFDSNLKATGNATLTYVDGAGSFALQDTKYDIGLFGAGAAEVAGGIYTDAATASAATDNLQQLTGGYGFAGKQ